jgi:hypothetical protein
MALLLVVHGGCAISPENRDPLFRIALLKPGIPARDDASSNRHPAPSILFEHDLRANAYRVCPEGKPVPLFRIMLRGRFPPKRKPGQKDRATPYALRRNIFRKRQKTMVCLAFG